MRSWRSFLWAKLPWVPFVLNGFPKPVHYLALKTFWEKWSQTYVSEIIFRSWRVHFWNYNCRFSFPLLRELLRFQYFVPYQRNWFGQFWHKLNKYLYRYITINTRSWFLCSLDNFKDFKYSRLTFVKKPVCCILGWPQLCHLASLFHIFTYTQNRIKLVLLKML